jgi:hypothetical protein
MLLLLDESVEPANDITAVVAGDDVNHQGFYALNGDNISIAYLDFDANGHPLGTLMSTTSGPGESSLTIVIRNQPNKGDSGVPQGEISNAVGNTDIEVTFEVEVR